MIEPTDAVSASLVRGPRAESGAAPDLLIEVPHGATRTADYTALERLLRSPLPPSLIDFFYVNTDAGAFELAVAVARNFVALEPSRSVALLRCLVPRTFIDCNRRVEASPEAFREGRVTPGLMPWVTDADDRALLRARYDAYLEAVRIALDELESDGAMLLLHTYAPRTIDVEVDEHIVESLHRAYAPEVEPTWPLRPEVDFVGRDLEGRLHVPAAVVEALERELGALGVTLGTGDTYPLHPSTLAWDHVMNRPDRALCLEVRRDLLAEPFEPFTPMHIGEAKVARLAGPLARALRAWW